MRGSLSRKDGIELGLCRALDCPNIKCRPSKGLFIIGVQAVKLAEADGCLPEVVFLLSRRLHDAVPSTAPRRLQSWLFNQTIMRNRSPLPSAKTCRRHMLLRLNSPA